MSQLFSGKDILGDLIQPPSKKPCYHQGEAVREPLLIIQKSYNLKV